MKLNTGEVVKQFLLNWLDYIKTVDDKITTQAGSGGQGGGNIFSNQFKLIDGAIWWDPAWFTSNHTGEATQISAEKEFTSQTINGSGATLFKVLYSNPISENVRLEFDIKLNQVVVENVNLIEGMSIYYADGINNATDPNYDAQQRFCEISHDMTSEYVTISLPLFSNFPGSPPVYESTQYSLILKRSPSNIYIEDATFSVRNVKLFNGDGKQIVFDDFVAGGFFTETTIAEGQIIESTTPLAGTQVQHLILTGAGVKPTMPTEGIKPGETGWLKTDILPAVWAWNITDDIWYYNNGSSIKAFEGSGGGKRQERFSLIGHTVIPTAFEDDVSILAVPKYLNLSRVRLINQSDSSEIPILTGGALEEMPIAVPAGDYNYALTYEEGKESGVLLINFS